MQATIGECKAVQGKYDDAIKSLNRTCRTKFIELFANSREACNVPESWLEEEDCQVTKEKLKIMRAGGKLSMSQLSNSLR